MSVQVLESKKFNQSTDDVRPDLILNRFDSVIAEMARLGLDTLITEITQLRRLIQDVLTSRPLADDAAFDQQSDNQTISSAENATTSESQGNSFLLSIAGLGSSTEGNLSERDEEILAAEIHPIYGWTTKQDD